MKRHVTKTGRALSVGRVTRQSTKVKRPGGRPLPLHLQCHPKRMTPTPLHPECRTFDPLFRSLAVLLDKRARRATIEYATGEGLFDSGPVRVVVDGFGVERYAPSVDYAMSWKTAAEAVGFRVFVYYTPTYERLNV